MNDRIDLNFIVEALQAGTRQAEGPQYWRSLEELVQSEEFQRR